MAAESQSRDDFREAVKTVLERNYFYKPSFSIYASVAGFYDYGPPGVGLKRNLLDFWFKHFVVEEDMHEEECSNLTPESVLKASGHVDRFTDVMVKDEKTDKCYRADHLIKEFLENKIVKEGPNLTSEQMDEMNHWLKLLDQLHKEELGLVIKLHDIRSPDTGNQLTDPYPFNLMYQTKVGPTGTNISYLRPELAQGLFVNFNDLYRFNRKKLPFAAAQIGRAFRNEISPRQGLLRVREFTLAEIEHFMDPDNKTHSKFANVADLECLMFSREDQVYGCPARPLVIAEAVRYGIVDNETLGYFIGRVYQFLTSIGIKKDRLRFRQHLVTEKAHYATDCWDAEIECSYGWIECVGIADRSTYDLRAHSDKSGVPLVGNEKYSQPKEIEKLVIAPMNKELGLAFKGSQKMVVEALKAMGEKEAMELKATLESKGEAEFRVCTLDKVVTIKKNMVSIEKKMITEHERVFTPAVIEPSFGIGRIMYCLFEHSFYTRPSKDGDEQLNVFKFPSFVAPYTCAVFPLVQKSEYEAVAEKIYNSLKKVGIRNMPKDFSGASIGKKYAKADEMGVPFVITVDSASSVTIRERDSKEQIRVNADEVVSVIKEVIEGRLTWSELLLKYPVGEMSVKKSEK